MYSCHGDFFVSMHRVCPTAQQAPEAESIIQQQQRSREQQQSRRASLRQAETVSGASRLQYRILSARGKD